MRMVERRVDDVTILQLIGRLELEDGDTTLRDAINALVAEGRAKIVLDLKEVTRLDSAGIGMLVSKLLTARRGGGNLKLLNPTARTDRLMEITKLNTIFEIFRDEEAAIRSFGGPPAAAV
jgi:anti-sigma B factor antagonist